MMTESHESRESGGRATVRHVDEPPRNDVPAGTATSYQLLVGADDGAPNFAMRKFTMGEGGGMPLHTNAVEHEQYVLQGRARIRIADAVHDVGAGNVLYIPAGAPHSYEVVEAPFEFLCMVPNGPDRVDVVDED